MVFKNIQKFIPKSEFVKNILTLLTGTTIAQIVPIVVMPILTRLYSPIEFGELGIFISIAGLISVIATLRYELAIILPKKDEDAINVLALSLILSFFMCIISFLIILLFHNSISSFYKCSNLDKCLFLVPLSILFIGIYQSFNYWANRKKQYKRIAISRIYQTSSAAITNIFLGVTKFIPNGLILGTVIGQAFSATVFIVQTWKDDKEKIKFISKEKIIKQAIIYKDFPRINSLHAFVDTFKEALIIFMIPFFFGMTTLGYYALGLKIVSLPIGLISVSVSQVFYQKASHLYANDGDLPLLIKKTLIKMGLLILPFFIILILFAPNIFSLIFGEEWREAGEYIQILSPWLFFRFLNSIMAQVPMITNKLKEIFIISFIANLLIILSILYGGYIAHDIKQGFYVLSFSLSIFFLWTLFWVYSISKKTPC